MARIDRLFDELLQKKGSDLHLGIGYPPLARIRGELAPLRDGAVDKGEMEALLGEILTPSQKKRLDAELELDFAHAYETRARFRANYFFKTSGLAAVFRVVPTNVQSLADLGAPDAVRRMAERRAGLVLVTGPTGSGKSTTLAALIDHINATRACHILTLEDPIEFVHEPKKAQVTHREIGEHASSFAAAIRSASREDPNVVLIGELRNHETMKLALGLAGQGVLVLSTVHTNSAPATIDRFVNAFPADEQPMARGMLTDSLVGIVAQQLLKAKDGHGRVAALEILVATSAIAAMIRENKTFQVPSVMQAGQTVGMQTMDMALERLLGQGRITPEVALDAATDREAMARIVSRTRPDLAEIQS